MLLAPQSSRAKFLIASLVLLVMATGYYFVTKARPSADSTISSANSFDTNFGAGKGYTQTIFPDLWELESDDFVIQPEDQKIITASIHTTKALAIGGTAGHKVILTRYYADGTLDTTFGGGSITTPIAISPTVFYSALEPWKSAKVELTSDKKIVVAGASDGGAVIGRYLADGTIDTTFGINSAVPGFLTLPGKLFTARDVDFVLTNDGSVIVAFTDAVSRHKLNIIKLTSTGEVSSSQSIPITVASDTSITADVMAINNVLHDANSIYISGLFEKNNTNSVYGDASSRYLATIKVTSSGQLDTTFGVNGLSVQDDISRDYHLKNVQIANGRIYYLTTGKYDTTVSGKFMGKCYKIYARDAQTGTKVQSFGDQSYTHLKGIYDNCSGTDAGFLTQKFGSSVGQAIVPSTFTVDTNGSLFILGNVSNQAVQLNGTTYNRPLILLKHSASNGALDRTYVSNGLKLLGHSGLLNRSKAMFTSGDASLISYYSSVIGGKYFLTLFKVPFKDIQSPAFTSGSSAPAEHSTALGGKTKVSSCLADSAGISNVLLEFSNPDGTKPILKLDKISGTETNGCFSADASIPYNKTSQSAKYIFTQIAINKLGGIKRSATSDITVVGNAPARFVSGSGARCDGVTPYEYYQSQFNNGGGFFCITTTVADPDTIDYLEMEFLKPDGTIATLKFGQEAKAYGPDSGSWTDGTWSGVASIPKHSWLDDPSRPQVDEIYRLTIIAHDKTGATIRSSTSDVIVLPDDPGFG